MGGSARSVEFVLPKNAEWSSRCHSRTRRVVHAFSLSRVIPELSAATQNKFCTAAQQSRESKTVLCWPLAIREWHTMGKMPGELVWFGNDRGHLILRFSVTRIRHFSRNHPNTSNQGHAFLGIGVSSNKQMSVMQERSAVSKGAESA